MDLQVAAGVEPVAPLFDQCDEAVVTDFAVARAMLYFAPLFVRLHIREFPTLRHERLL